MKHLLLDGGSKDIDPPGDLSDSLFKEHLCYDSKSRASEVFVHNIAINYRQTWVSPLVNEHCCVKHW